MSLPLKLFLATLLGALLGLERESSGGRSSSTAVSGIRTYALISLMGALAGVFFNSQARNLFLVTAITVCGLIVAYYVVGSLITKRSGITTEISLVFTFLLGVIVMTEVLSIQIILALLVVVLLILSMKARTKRLMLGITPQETESFISYAIIALVILPFLPNRGFHLQDIPTLVTILDGYNIHLGALATIEIVNPRKLWFIVALVTGIDVFGYILGRILGNKKSFTMASFVGGFISSTSTTQSLAQQSKRSPVALVHTLLGAAVAANLASFFQVFLLVAPLNPQWLVRLTPILLIIIVAAVVVSIFFLTKKQPEATNGEAEKAGEQKRIFSLVSALKFALLLTSVKLATKVCLAIFGQSGFLISSIIASFAGLDAIIINLAELAGKLITFKTAVLTFVLVNATNLLSKTVYSFIQGNRKFAVKFGAAMAVIIGSSLVGYVILF